MLQTLGAQGEPPACLDIELNECSLSWPPTLRKAPPPSTTTSPFLLHHICLLLLVLFMLHSSNFKMFSLETGSC